MKRVLLLVIVALLVASVSALSSDAAAWHTTVITKSYGKNPSGYNLGVSTYYGYSAPALDTHPQFYSSAATHNTGRYAAFGITITVTGVDPRGAPLGGNRFVPLSALMSPNNQGTASEAMNAVVDALINAIPYGAGTTLKNLANTQPTNYDSTKAWGQTTCVPGCWDQGLEFGFQIQIDPQTPGSYSIHIVHHFQNSYNFGKQSHYIYTDLSVDLVYCYQYCSYGVQILTSNQQRGGPPGCQPVMADVYRDGVKIGTSDITGHYTDAPQAGMTHSYYAMLPPYSSSTKSVSGASSIELCVVTPY